MKDTLKAVGVIVVAVVIGVLLLQGHVAAPSGNPTATVTYLCAKGKGIVASFYDGSSTPATSPDQPPKPGGSVALTLSTGEKKVLAQTISADGGRYANPDESFVFWGKGNSALVLENGKEENYIGCIVVAPTDASLPIAYANSGAHFSIRLPEGYGIDEKYQYQELGPGREIPGVRFTIPPTVATGTNLAADSYLSVEEVSLASTTSTCSASLFLDGVKPQVIKDVGVTYSIGATLGAGAGNRYEEVAFAIQGTNPCIAVRYFIHSGVFENYPAGSVKAFDEKALVAQFDAIRHSLIIAE